MVTELVVLDRTISVTPAGLQADTVTAVAAVSGQSTAAVEGPRYELLTFYGTESAVNDPHAVNLRSDPYEGTVADPNVDNVAPPDALGLASNGAAARWQRRYATRERLRGLQSRPGGRLAN